MNVGDGVQLRNPMRGSESARGTVVEVVHRDAVVAVRWDNRPGQVDPVLFFTKDLLHLDPEL